MNVKRLMTTGSLVLLLSGVSLAKTPGVESARPSWPQYVADREMTGRLSYRLSMSKEILPKRCRSFPYGRKRESPSCGLR